MEQDKLPCYAALAAVQNDETGSLHVSCKKHANMIAFTLPHWQLSYDRGNLTGAYELAKTVL